MKKTIFNVYVEMTSQEQCDRMRQVCIDNGLPIWNDEIAFELLDISRFFRCLSEEFFIGASVLKHAQVSETEFLQLLKEYKNENN